MKHCSINLSFKIDATPAYIDTVVDRLNGDMKDGMRKHHVQCIKCVLLV